MCWDIKTTVLLPPSLVRKEDTICFLSMRLLKFNLCITDKTFYEYDIVNNNY